MAETIAVDSNKLLRVKDNETVAPAENTGRPDYDETDYLEIEGNISSTTPHIIVTAKNDNEDDVQLRLAGKGDGGTLVKFLQTDVDGAGDLGASNYTGYVILVTDGAAGNPTLAYSDGTNWKRLDGAGGNISKT